MLKFTSQGSVQSNLNGGFSSSKSEQLKCIWCSISNTLFYCEWWLEWWWRVVVEADHHRPLWEESWPAPFPHQLPSLTPSLPHQLPFLTPSHPHQLPSLTSSFPHPLTSSPAPFPHQLPSITSSLPHHLTNGWDVGWDYLSSRILHLPNLEQETVSMSHKCSLGYQGRRKQFFDGQAQ